MVLLAAGGDPPGLDLVLPDSAGLLWGVLGLVLPVAIAAGVLVFVVNGVGFSQYAAEQDARLNELANRVRALEDEAQRQEVE